MHHYRDVNSHCRTPDKSVMISVCHDLFISISESHSMWLNIAENHGKIKTWPICMSRAVFVSNSSPRERVFASWQQAKCMPFASGSGQNVCNDVETLAVITQPQTKVRWYQHVMIQLLVSVKVTQCGSIGMRSNEKWKLHLFACQLHVLLVTSSLEPLLLQACKNPSACH